MAFLLNPQVWASLLTLTALEIVLGIDKVLDDLSTRYRCSCQDFT